MLSEDNENEHRKDRVLVKPSKQPTPRKKMTGTAQMFSWLPLSAHSLGPALALRSSFTPADLAMFCCVVGKRFLLGGLCEIGQFSRLVN